MGFQRTLLASGSTGSMRLDDSENTSVSGRLVSGRILETGDITTRTVDVPAEFTSGSGGAKIQMIASSSGTVPVTIDRGLVIAGEGVEVEVSNNFTGLILSAGKVTIRHASNPTLKADMVLMDQIMEYIKSDPDLAKIFKGFNGQLTDNPTEAARCISYDNWTKNDVQN